MISFVLFSLVWTVAQGDTDGTLLTPETFPHAIHRTEIPNDSDPSLGTHFQYWIRIDDTGQEFALGRLYEDENVDDYYKGLGYNAESLELRWLEPNEVLWIHWETLSQGSGRYIAQGNVVLVNSDRRWSEIVRDCRPSYSRGYSLIGAYADRVRMQFSWQSEPKTLYVRETASWSEWDDEERPLGRRHESGDVVAYGGEYSLTREWDGGLIGGTIVFDKGKEYLATRSDDSVKELAAQSDADAFTVGEFAKYLASRMNTPDALKTLLEIHPGLTAESPAEEPFLITEPIPPFEPQPNDIYHTGL